MQIVRVETLISKGHYPGIAEWGTIRDQAQAAREAINPEALKYINRLSDHLFVLARTLNDGGKADVLWRPGANR